MCVSVCVCVCVCVRECLNLSLSEVNGVVVTVQHTHR